MQNQHNAIYREEEREMMPMLKYYGVGTIPWGPIAAGRTSSRHIRLITERNSHGHCKHR